MDSDTRVAVFAWLVIAAGALLSFAAAVIPHYDAGYRLAGGVLFVGLAPYVAYGALLRVLRPAGLVACGTLLLVIDAAVTVPERFVRFDGYSSGLIYYAPLAAALLVVPLFALFARRRGGAGR